jgi:hypothetical protein
MVVVDVASGGRREVGVGVGVGVGECSRNVTVDAFSGAPALISCFRSSLFPTLLIGSIEKIASTAAMRNEKKEKKEKATVGNDMQVPTSLPMHTGKSRARQSQGRRVLEAKWTGGALSAY